MLDSLLRMAKDFKGLLLLIALLLINTFSSTAAPDGKAIFQANCASCHHPTKKATGPALQGVSGRVPSKEWIYNWVHNSAGVIASGDKYANDLFVTNNKTAMTAFPGLKTEEIDAVIKYVEEYKEIEIVTGPTGTPKESDNTLLYAVLTILLLVVAIVLTSVNKHWSKELTHVYSFQHPHDNTNNLFD